MLLIFLNFWIFRFFTIWPVGVWERVQNIPGGSGNISGYRELHSENFMFFTFSADFRPSQLDVHFPNSGATTDHAMAPPLSLTHPERCAAKLCARKYRKSLRIFRLRPDHDKKMFQKYLKMFTNVLGTCNQVR